MKKLLLILLLLLPAPLVYAGPCDSLQKRCDSLQWVIRDKDFRLNRVKFYLNICIKHPNQDKFLKGWIKRAIQ